MKKLVGLACGLFWAATAGAAQLSVEFTFSADDVSLTPAGEYTEVGLAGGSRVGNEPGAPSIPAKFVNILLPTGAGNIRISASGTAMRARTRGRRNRRRMQATTTCRAIALCRCA